MKPEQGRTPCPGRIRERTMPENSANRNLRQADLAEVVENQEAKIALLLREAKVRGEGVSKADLIFQYRYTQCAARIFSLEKRGWVIAHRQIPGQRFVSYFLVSE